DDAGDSQGLGGSAVLGTDVAGGHEDGESGTEIKEFAREIEAAHAGHGKVGADRGEMVGTGTEIVESRGSIDVAGDLIAEALQEECAEHDEALFVIDVQNIFVVAAFHRLG